MRPYPDSLDAAWEWLLALAHGEPSARPHFSGDAHDLVERFLPLFDAVAVERPYVVAHMAQSLDGRIALPCGSSQWITGPADLEHTHRLRALCDAVLVGANTVVADDPQLTVRRVPGPNPLRVVLDPRSRVPAERRVFQDGLPTLRVCRAGAPAVGPGVEDLQVAGPP